MSQHPKHRPLAPTTASTLATTTLPPTTTTITLSTRNPSFQALAPLFCLLSDQNLPRPPRQPRLGSKSIRRSASTARPSHIETFSCIFHAPPQDPTGVACLPSLAAVRPVEASSKSRVAFPRIPKPFQSPTLPRQISHHAAAAPSCLCSLLGLCSATLAAPFLSFSLRSASSQGSGHLTIHPSTMGLARPRQT